MRDLTAELALVEQIVSILDRFRRLDVDREVPQAAAYFLLL